MVMRFFCAGSWLGWSWESLELEDTTSSSVCPLTVLLPDVMGLWESCLQKVTGTSDLMEQDYSATPSVNRVN